MFIQQPNRNCLACYGVVASWYGLANTTIGASMQSAIVWSWEDFGAVMWYGLWPASSALQLCNAIAIVHGLVRFCAMWDMAPWIGLVWYFVGSCVLGCGTVALVWYRYWCGTMITWPVAAWWQWNPLPLLLQLCLQHPSHSQIHIPIEIQIQIQLQAPVEYSEI